MTLTDEKTIALSKTKILLLVLGSLAFVGIGVWMVSMDATLIAAQRRFNSPLLIHGLGYLSIVFFGLCGVIGLNKVCDKKPGLILSNTGITENTSGLSAGFVPWHEVTGFAIYQTHKQKMLVVLVNNPEKYIEIGSAFRRTLIKASYHMSGSPVVITPNALTINFEELLNICTEYFAKYGHAH